MRAVFFAAVLVVVWGQVSAAHAETCPEVPDDEVALRRSMAKEWFAKAEESEAAGDRQGAVRRYACSLNLAPHPSTAYNLGTVAEKSGDLSMALDGFRTYLKLATEATDRPAIEARIVALEAKISELRKIAPKPHPGDLATATTTPAPQPTAPPPAVTRTTPPPSDEGSPARKVVAWTFMGGAVATLASGIVFNMLARSKMDQCYSQFDARTPGALDRCKEAKPLAYTSYALFGATAALGATGALLLLWSPDNTAAAEGTSISLVPTAGGAALLATGRF
jgi:hypothetical protein